MKQTKSKLISNIVKTRPRDEPSFRDRAYALVLRIPRERLMTYGLVARVLGEGYDARAEIDGIAMVVRVIDAVETGGVDRLVVVTGYQPDHIAAATTRRGRRITYNERHAKGMGTSIAAGI